MGGTGAVKNLTNASAVAGDIVVSGASAIANAATRTLVNGSDFGDNLVAALPDVIGGAVGRSLGRGVVAGLSEAARPPTQMSPDQTAAALVADIKSLNDGVPLTQAQEQRMKEVTSSLPNQIAKARSLGASSNENERMAGAALAQEIRMNLGGPNGDRPKR